MKKLSDDEKIKRGTDQPSRMNGSSVQWEMLSEIPQCPEHFGSDMRECWMDLCGQLLKAGLLAIPYLRLIEAYCSAYATWSAAYRGMKIEGLYEVTTNMAGIKKITVNPLSKVMTATMATMLAYAGRLGVTPRDVDAVHGSQEHEEKGSLLK